MKRLDTIAQQAAKYLFTNGQGEQALQLQLVSSDGRNLGGWGIISLAEVIYKALLEATVKPKPPPKKRGK